MEIIDEKLNNYFAGKVVRKDLTKKIKEGANVPVYVLEYLLGMYCATSDEDAIADGIKTVKNILAENFVRPDEAEKVKSKIREKGIYTVIDKITVKLNEKLDVYQAEFSNLVTTFLCGLKIKFHIKKYNSEIIAMESRVISKILNLFFIVTTILKRKKIFNKCQHYLIIIDIHL